MTNSNVPTTSRPRRTGLFIALVVGAIVQVLAFVFVWTPASLPDFPFTGTVFDDLISPVAISAVVLFFVVLVLSIIAFVRGPRRLRIAAGIVTVFLLAELAWELVIIPLALESTPPPF